MNKIEYQINQDLASVMAIYGDSPDELFIKLREIVLVWFRRGVASKIASHEEQPAIIIKCPECQGTLKIHHLNWEAIRCIECGSIINRMRVMRG